MAEMTIGRCSNCGGDVRVHSGAWYGVNPPVPRCSGCGAQPMNNGPVVPMGPPDYSGQPGGGPTESQQDYFGIGRRR